MNEYSSVTWEHVTLYKKPLCTVEFKWKIENFSLLPKVVDTFYDSPLFSHGDMQWCVRLFPNGESQHSSEGWIALYLNLIKCKTILKNVSCVFSIVKINGEKEFQKGFYLILLAQNNMQGLKNFLEKDKLIRRKTEFYPSDTLNISVWLQYENPEHLIYEVLTSSWNIETKVELNLSANGFISHNRLHSIEFLKKIMLERYFRNQKMPETIGNISIGGPWKENLDLKGFTMLSNDLKNAFLTQKYHDITINVKGENFKAHKVILMARSEVLSSMLTHNMAEKNNKVINIYDCEPGAFAVFLVYLYSGKADNLSETNMLHVYYIADKYNVPDLKSICVVYIKCSMSVKTIFSIIRLARKHGDSELLTCATDFFILNVHAVLLTEEWKLFIKDYPAYGNELYVRAIKSPNI